MPRTIGEIMLLGANYAPEGWMPCNGASLNVDDYQELYSVIGNIYGGVPNKTFNLPKKAAIDGNEQFICVQGVYPESMDGELSQIKVFAGKMLPRFWIKCDGSLLKIEQYTELFSLLGTRWGGDGRTTFGIPKLSTTDGGTYLLYTYNSIGPSPSTDADPYISEIGLFPLTFTLRGWFDCKGQTLPIQNHQSLYSLIGSRYPDGQMSFKLPTIPPLDQCVYQINNGGTYPPRSDA